MSEVVVYFSASLIKFIYPIEPGCHWCIYSELICEIDVIRYVTSKAIFYFSVYHELSLYIEWDFTE